MWTNNMLKQNAWNLLKTYYWTAFGVTLLTSILTGGSNGLRFTNNSNTEYSYQTDYAYQPDISIAESMGYIIGLLIGVLIVTIIISIVGLAIYAFLGGIVKCGECKFFCKARTGDVNFGYLFDNFQGGRYKKTAKVMFNTQLQIFLWSLLLIIPGIIKSYEYYLVPYLMSENADLSKERAQEISKQTMNGEKWKLFMLQFSFIGWYLLGLLACFVGVIFVTPYYEATMAEFYTCMRAKMISYSITSEEELTGYYNNFGNPFDNNNYNNNNYNNYNQPQNNPYDNQPYQNNPYQNNNYNMPNNNSNHVNLDKNNNNNNNNDDYYQNY
ncbi:MAG: DUF975 family protein [Oscillospiraceae bacterium]|nr:DUF975 family protein [Oscillospiraceae bacterium]